MKKIIFVSVFTLMFGVVFSQNESDALRYSQNLPYGTARFMGMAGAYGAVGADFSTLSQNPAGLGLYRSSELTLGANLGFNNNTTSFYNQKSKDYTLSSNFNNFGFVTGYIEEDKKNDTNFVKPITHFALGYNRLNNFNSEKTINKDNLSGSMIDAFVDNITGTLFNQLDTNSTEYSAYWLFLVNEDTTSPGSYYKNITSTYGQKMMANISSSGGIGEFVVSMGTNFMEKVFLGATIGFPRIEYEQNYTYKEYNFAEIDSLSNFVLKQNFKTTGKGINLKVGLIIKPIDWLKIGAAFHSPTNYELTDEYTNSLKVKFNNGWEDEVSRLGVSEYSLLTPMKAIFSTSFLINNSAIVSADYEVTKYSDARIKDYSLEYDYSNINNTISTLYKTGSNLRIGAEYAWGPYRFRCGYSYMQSAYNKGANLNSNTHIASCGAGIKNKYSYIDVAFMQVYKDEYLTFYDSYTNPINIAKFSSIKNILSVTAGLRF